VCDAHARKMPLRAALFSLTRNVCELLFGAFGAFHGFSPSGKLDINDSTLVLNTPFFLGKDMLASINLLMALNLISGF